MLNKIDIEICSNSVLSAWNALSAGATRVELCRNLPVGGVTPEMPDVAFLCRKTPLEVRVLIRPREGDFCYNDEEFAQMVNDVLHCKALGAKAVVVGFLTPDGRIDTEKTRQIVEIAAPMEVTFHRAFDELKPAEAEEALEEVIACGCHKLLTSGCHPTALQGAEVIRKLVARANGRIGIIAASGVTPDNAVEIIRRTGVKEIHGSCKGREAGMEVSQVETVAALRKNIGSMKTA